MLASFTVAALIAAQATAAPIHANADTGQPDRIAIGAPEFQVISDNEIIIDGVTYNSWAEVANSGFFQDVGTRCATHTNMADVGLRGSGTDCSFQRTSVEGQYEPSNGILRIPVVVHVIQRTNGTGFISDAEVRSQIDILNEDFKAIPGTFGANGDDAQIEFFLATEDPNGNPTDGITNSTNNTWFSDAGSYWNTLNWDPSRYLNIYTNSASGALGYVPELPQGGIVGSTSDRVVVLYSTFGRNAPFAPFNLGRTGTHEVGHYLGLLHTFSNGCPSASSCSTNGDLICDTNPESSPTFGCPSSRQSCGFAAPKDNYMDYADDICMQRFTPDQINRMRCTLENFRPDLAIQGEAPCADADLAAPFGVIDLTDVNAFIAAFIAQGEDADLAPPAGVLDLSDVQVFVEAFNTGCP